jgi:hypothetical protein
MTGPLAAYAANTFLLSSALSKEPIMFIHILHERLESDRMFMTGYSAYSEGYELQHGFSMDNLDAPHWIPAGSTKRSFGDSYALSSFWISLSYNRIS